MQYIGSSHMQDIISIKGGRDGLRIIIDEQSNWLSVTEALKAQFEQSGNFFAGAHMIVEIGNRQVSEAELSEMITLMQTYGLQPESIATAARESRNAARSLGFSARIITPDPPPTTNANASENDGTLVCRTIRSGQVLRHQGHITLIGDINPGAQVIAGGSIIVWGCLRGMVHAGALGDESAIVCALVLRPTQLRIAHSIAEAWDESGYHPAEVARIEQEHIVVESWEAYKRV